MRETITITIKKDKQDQINQIKRACDHLNISFSSMCCDSVIDYFEKGKFSGMVKLK